VAGLQLVGFEYFRDALRVQPPVRDRSSISSATAKVEFTSSSPNSVAIVRD